MSQSPQTPASRPAARRGRISHACVACQQKKQKCDGGSPSCRNCLRGNRLCIIQDPSTKRRHPRGYVESLEQHVAFLERTLQDCQPGVDINVLTSKSTLEDGESTAVEEEIVLSDSPARHSASGDSLDSLDMLCLQSGGGEPHYFGSSSSYYMTKLFCSTLRAVRAQGPGLTMAGIPDATVISRPQVVPCTLPDAATTRKLSRAYFDQVHMQFPFLHRDTYDEWEAHVFAAYKAGTAPDPQELYFVYAVAAVGALIGPLASTSLPEGLYAAAAGLFEQVLKRHGLASIQAILCCAMYTLRSPVGVSVWTLSGMALRQCVELGLHRKIPWAKVDPNELKVQTRRRVFWCCYNLDRATAMTLGRPVGIADYDIDVELPLDISDAHLTANGLLAAPRTTTTAPPTTVSAAIHTIRARQLCARIQSSMYPQTGVDAPVRIINSLLTQSFHEELKEWLDTAPAQNASCRRHNNAFGSPEWFQLIYYHSLLLLHRHSLVAEGPMLDRAAQTAAILECATSAVAICQLYRQLYVTHRLYDTWGSLHVLFLSGITFLYCLWTSPETRAVYRQDKVASTCASCIMVLAVMTERWAAAQPYRDTFEILANYTQTMLAEGEAAAMMAAMPVVSVAPGHQLTDFMESMSEIGMCSLVEPLLNDMIVLQ